MIKCATQVARCLTLLSRDLPFLHNGMPVSLKMVSIFPRVHTFYNVLALDLFVQFEFIIQYLGGVDTLDRRFISWQSKKYMLHACISILYFLHSF